MQVPQRRIRGERATATKEPDQVMSVKKLVGDWKLNIRITMPDGSILNGSGKAQGRLIAMGQGVHIILKATIPGLGDIEEHDLVGFNASGDQRIHFFSLISTGTTHDHVGAWRDDKTMEVRWEGIEDGKEVIETDVFTWISPGELHIRQEETVEGQTGLTGEYILKKLH